MKVSEVNSYNIKNKTLLTKNDLNINGKKIG